MPKKTVLSIFFLLCLTVTSAFAHPEALSYFERSLGAGAETSIDLAQEDLGALADSLREGSPEFSSLLANVNSARMRQFKLADDMSGAALASFNDTTDDLRDAGWMNLVSIKNGHSRVQVFLDLKGETIHGLVALFTEQDEAGYASVTGKVDMAQIMSLTQSLQGLPQILESLEEFGDSSN